jgi:hypothetical protein
MAAWHEDDRELWDITSGMLVGVKMDTGSVKAFTRPGQRKMGHVRKFGKCEFHAFLHVPPRGEKPVGIFATIELAVEAITKAEKAEDQAFMLEASFLPPLKALPGMADD